jgi:cholesterol 7-dehydrogenase
VELVMETTFGRGVFLQTVTPVAPLLQRVTHRLYTTPYMPALFSNIMILGEAIMVRTVIAAF